MSDLKKLVVEHMMREPVVAPETPVPTVRGLRSLLGASKLAQREEPTDDDSLTRLAAQSRLENTS